MRKYLHKIGLTMFLVTLISSGQLYSQCPTTIYGQYPSGTFNPLACGVVQTLTTCAYASEYTVVNLTAGSSYTFYTSVATDVITITDNATNTVQVFGTGSVVFNCTTSGLYRFNRHLAGCGAQATCRNAYMVLGPPAFNDCSGALTMTPGTINGTLACATTDVAPVCGGVTDGASGGVWYKFTPVCSGSTLTLSLCGGAAFDTRLRVFDGTCGALNCVAGNDDFCSTQSEVTWTGTGGTTYYVLVYGATLGTFTMNFTEVEAVAPVPDVASLPTINSPCAVTLTAPTATDNCAGAVTGTAPTTTFSLNGTYNVTWTYDDGNGNTSTQSQTVIVADNTGPVAMLPSDTTISADPGGCCATFTFSQAAGPVITQLGNGFEDGWTNNGIYSTADDIDVPAGSTWNVDAVTFDAFTIAPLPSSIDVYFYDDAGGYPGTVIATDNITSANYTSSIVGSNFGINVYHYVFNLTTPVSLAGGVTGATYWIAFQNNGTGASYWEVSSLGAYGNNALQVNGNIAAANWAGPYVNTGADHVFSISVSAVPLFVDGCNGPVTELQTAGNASGTCFPLGTTTNTFTGTDENGNVTTGTFTVTVIDDQAPIPNVDSSAAYGFSSTNVPLAIVDNGVMMDSIMVSGLPTSLNSGDLASVCLDIFHSFDSDLTIDLISPSGTIFNLSTANGGAEDNYIGTCFDMSAAASINTGDAPFVGSFIPEGAGGFDVFNGEDPNGYWKLMITDGFNGDAGALTQFHINFDFHWEDLLPSVIGGCVTLTPPTATDNCNPSLPATTTDPTTYNTDGTYSVTWTYTDGSGNTTTQTQSVIVDDVTAPVADVASLPIVTGSCSVNVGAIPTATDGCTGTITATTTDALTYNTAGVYTITWVYDDGNGNTTTQDQTVIVTDNENPVPSQPILPNVVGNCVVTVSPAPTANDNCAGVITGTTTDPTTYNVVGTFFITWLYDDGNGNTWTQNQTVVVNPCLGIEDEAGQWTALIYPNPSSGIFTLDFSEIPSENTQIRLVDGLGQVLYSGIAQGQTQQFDFSYLASATYYLLITSNNGQISKPVIIRHNY
jgi:subtilisin-like proprotein convertase family protein